DSDHANCPETSRSISGYVLRLNGWSFAFKSKKQKTVTDDTCKSELVAASACVESLLWVHELLKEVGMEMGTPELRLDNQSTLKVCDNVGNYEGVKRYAKLSHKIAELVEGNKLTLDYVPTTENIADMDCYQYLNKKAKVQDEQSTVVRKEDGSKKKKKKDDDKRKVGLVDHIEILNAGESSSDDEGMVGMVLPTATKRDQSQWMLDTGTSTHVCVDREAFTTQKQSKMSFKVWNGQVTHGVMSGTVVIHTKNLAGCGSVKLSLGNVEYSPHGSVNLISLGVMEDNDWQMSSNSSGETSRKIFLYSSRNNERIEFVKRGKHYWLKTVENKGDLVDGVAMMSVDEDANELRRWHERLGHLNVATIKHMVDSGTVLGMNIPAALLKKKFVCLSCMSAKRKRMSYKTSAVEKRTKVNYERLMSDTCDMGKYLPGLKGIRLVSELLAAGHRVTTFTSDGGGEFVNKELKQFLGKHGIRFVPTYPYTPEENALVEKLNGVLVNKMCAAMYAADLPNRLWPEVLPYIVDIDNVSATRALKGKTPSEKLFGKAPDVKKIRVCGSVGFVYVPKRKTKLSAKAEPALLLAIWLVVNLHNKKKEELDLVAATTQTPLVA
ncbi:Gag Polyprotein, partial [Phytophthora megakarya]